MTMARVENIGAKPRSTGTCPVIDRAHLARFTMGSADLEAEVLLLFIQQAPITFGKLRDAVTQKDWHAAAHTLKGSARAVGAGQVAVLAEAAERLAVGGCPVERRSVVDALEAALAAAARRIDEIVEPVAGNAKVRALLMA